MHTREMIKRIEELNERVDDYIKMAGGSSSFSIKDIVKMIVKAYRELDHISIIISGKRGAGKTTLLAHILAHIYHDHGKPNYLRALDYIFFSPLEALNFMVESLKEKRPLVAIGLDDAGVWLSKWFVSKQKVMFLEFTNLFRMVIGSVIYTDPGSIHKYIRQISDIRIHVEKLNEREWKEYINSIMRVDPEYAQYLIDKNIRLSVAKVYHVATDVLDRVWIRKRAVMVFPLVLPYNFREKYDERRYEYTLDKATRLIEILLLENEIDVLEKKKKMLEAKIERLRKLGEREVKKLMRKYRKRRRKGGNDGG